MRASQIAVQIIHHHAAQRRTAETHSIIQQNIQSQRRNASLFDRDILLGSLSAATVEALGVTTRERSVLLRIRCKRHIRTARGADAEAVLDSLQNAIANVLQWKPGNLPRRFVLIGRDVIAGRELALVMELETDPDEQWVLVSARPFGKTVRRREERKLKSITVSHLPQGVVVTAAV